jgi:hypothetical protein
MMSPNRSLERSRTGLRVSKTEIGKIRPETFDQNVPIWRESSPPYPSDTRALRRNHMKYLLFSHPGDGGPETALAGWGARIRTWEWRNQNPLPYHLATPQRAPDHTCGSGADQSPDNRGPRCDLNSRRAQRLPSRAGWTLSVRQEGCGAFRSLTFAPEDAGVGITAFARHRPTATPQELFDRAAKAAFAAAAERTQGCRRLKG